MSAATSPRRTKESVPAHNTFTFDSITFSSSFDNGNLGRVERVPNRPFEFKVWTAPDNMGTEFQSKHCAWFHFYVTGLPLGCVLRMQLVNASNHSGLYKHDMRPVYRSNSTNQRWVRIRSSVRFVKEEDSAQLYFEHSVDSDNDKIYFAFTYPYSYGQVQAELANYDLHHNSFDVPNSIFYQRELLTTSCDGRRIDLLTITSVDGAHKTEREPLLPGLFPEMMSESQNKRPFVFPNKEVFLISARVHPGEVPAQHTFKGILSLLMDPEDQIAAALRARYIFKLIPMLNPDGVYRGHFRMDQFGHNLNRYYNNPDPTMQPAIFGAKALLDYYAQMGKLSVYLDMHAHASKRGCFIYGNVLDNVEDQIQNQLYCKLISMNSPHFDYEGCLFSREHMFRTDPGDQAKGLTAEGSGRVNTYLAYGLVHSYTLECNYNTSRIGNEVAPPEQEIRGNNATPASNFTTNPEKYTPASWAGVGRACVTALVDLRGQNPCSRIPRSKFKTLDRVRGAVVMEVRNRKEYAGKSVCRERRRSIVDKKLAGSSATTSDEFVWRRVVEGFEIPAAGSGSATASARNSTASLTLAAATAAAENAKESNVQDTNAKGGYLFIPAGKEKRRKSFNNVPLPSSKTSAAVTTAVEGSVPNTARQPPDSSGIATAARLRNNSSQVAASAAMLKDFVVAAVQDSLQQNTAPLSVKMVELVNTDSSSLDNSATSRSGRSRPRDPSTDSASPVVLESLSARVAVSNDNAVGPFIETIPPHHPHHNLVGNNPKQLQQYFSQSPTRANGNSNNGNEPNSATKLQRPRSADPNRLLNKRNRTPKRASNDVDGETDRSDSPPTSLDEAAQLRESEARSGIIAQSTVAATIPAVTSTINVVDAGNSRASKSSDSTRAQHGMGASIRDLIREQSIQKLIKLSSNQHLLQQQQPSPPTSATAPPSISHISSPATSGLRRGSNVHNQHAATPPSSTPTGSKDNRKLLGKTLHAAGVALLMTGSSSGVLGASSNAGGSNEADVAASSSAAAAAASVAVNSLDLSVLGLGTGSKHNSMTNLHAQASDHHATATLPIPHVYHGSHTHASH